MKRTVYIETTIVGHLASRLPKNQVVAGQMLMTRKWWAESRVKFDIFTSQAVIDEASKGDLEAAAERVEKLAEVSLVPVTHTAADLAARLVTKNALPTKARFDALHVAIAATNSLQYLLTWNCRHLANAVLRRRIEQICREQGYEPPVICTPFELEEIKP